MLMNNDEDKQIESLLTSLAEEQGEASISVDELVDERVRSEQRHEETETVIEELDNEEEHVSEVTDSAESEPFVEDVPTIEEEPNLNGVPNHDEENTNQEVEGINHEVTEPNHVEEITNHEVTESNQEEESGQEENYHDPDVEEEYLEVVVDEDGVEYTQNEQGDWVDEEGNVLDEDLVPVDEEEYELDEEVLEKRSEYLDLIEENMSTVDIEFELLSSQGGSIPTRISGNLDVVVVNIDDIKVTHRTRIGKKENQNLIESIQRFGVLTPVHLVAFGNYHILLDGYRRLEALKYLGKSEVVAIVDTTIPPELVKYYEAIVNGNLPYTFTEIMKFAKFVQETQPSMGVSTIEGILNLGHGEMYKALYVDSMKNDFPEPYQQLESGKLSIDQAFKKVEKEIADLEKEKDGLNNEDALNSGELDDKLSNTDELADMQNVPDQQNVNDRRTLDPILRRTIESRDGGHCQCCGYGKGVPEFMGVFIVHHIVAVMYGGSDSQSNLILICRNCHELVHDYESGRFHPEQETYDNFTHVKKVVVLGNILANLKKKALDVLRTKHEATARMVDRRKMGLGQAIHKHSILLDGEKAYDGSPYQTFLNVTENLQIGGDVKGELGVLNFEDEVEIEETD